jgi:hypothetical protein
MLNCYCREHLIFFMLFVALRVHLTFSLYTNYQNHTCGKEFNTTAFVNLLICNANVTIILWRNLNIVFMKLFPQSDLLSFPHGRFWQFVYKENVRCTRLMQRSLQVAIRQMFVLCSLKIELTFKYCVIKRISHYSIDAPGQLLKVSVAYWAPIVMWVPQKALKKIVISMLDCYCREHLNFLCFLWHWHHGWCYNI